MKKVLTFLLLFSMILPICTAFADNETMGYDIDFDTPYSSDQTYGIVNILLLGVDRQNGDIPDPGRSDCMMICSLNKDEGTIKLISIERGIELNIPGVGTDMLAHAHHYGGGELTQQLIEEYFAINLDGYIEIDYQGFIDAVNAIGGVDIEIEHLEMCCLNGWLWAHYPENSAQTMNKVEVGINHLDGYDSLQYVRLRAIDSDWHRIERQRYFIQQVLNQMKDASAAEIINMVKAVLVNTRTNLPISEICALIACAYKFKGAVAEQLTIPEHSRPIVCNYPVEAQKLNDFIYGGITKDNSEYESED